MDGVELPLSEGAEVKGRIVFQGSVKGAVVWLEPLQARALSASAAANEIGEFVVKGVPAATAGVRVMNLPQDIYVKAVTLGGRVVDAARFNPAGGEKLEIVLGRASAELTGVVVDAGDKPFAGATVVLVPESGDESLYRTAMSGEDGKFLIKSIAPGRYKALAWEDVEPDAWRDPDVVKRVEDRARHAELVDGGQGEIIVQVIPAGRE